MLDTFLSISFVLPDFENNKCHSVFIWMFCEGENILNLQSKFAKTETRHYPVYCEKGWTGKKILHPNVNGEKGTVNVISSGPILIEVFFRFTTVPLKVLSV